MYIGSWTGPSGGSPLEDQVEVAFGGLTWKFDQCVLAIDTSDVSLVIYRQSSDDGTVRRLSAVAGFPPGGWTAFRTLNGGAHDAASLGFRWEGDQPAG